MKHLYLLPWVVVGLAAIYVISPFFRPAFKSEFDLADFGALPVQDGGRIKPTETLARTDLLILSGKQTFIDDRNEDKPVTRPAIEWLLDVMTSPIEPMEGPAHKHKVFRIENDQVLAFMGLKARSGLRYSYSEFVDKVPDLGEEVERIENIEPKFRNLFESKLMELAHHVLIYKKLASYADPRVLPPRRTGDDRWLTLPEGSGQMEYVPLMRAYAGIIMAYGEGKAADFNRAVAAYREALSQRVPDSFPKAEFEMTLNRLEPFYKCMFFAVVMFLLGCFFWLLGYQEFRQAAFYLGIFMFLVQTWAMIGRIYLMGRPPVTNIYSSAIFIGWTTTGLCLVLEAVFRNGFAVVTASVTAFISLFISHMLVSGDTMEMLVAVLDTNIWLATHVVCVTKGYTATFVAGFLGILYIMLGVFTRVLEKDAATVLSKMIYGVICFATLLSFTGTVLGGIWADQSWGRFWGWDPKENGALLIVLWNALILHARWGGMVKQRGMAVLAVGGNIVTGWSWFGTNMLGVGLHSYGFMNGAVIAMIAADVAMLFIMGVGMIPTKYWTSFQPPTPKIPPPEPRTMAIPRLTSV